MELWQYKQLKQPKVKKEKKSKYHSTKVVVGGIKFDSKAEAEEWKDLCERQRKGEIEELARQVTFHLTPKRKYESETSHAMSYRADFVYNDKKLGWVVQDTKGYQTAEYKVKKKIFLEKYVWTGKCVFIESGKEKKVYKKV